MRSADGRGFVLKRMSLGRDWIMRATNDLSCREAMVAAAALNLPASVGSPALGAARDGDGYAVLMRDISRDLLPAGPIGRPALDLIIERMTELHAAAVPRADVPWCDVAARVLLLSPGGAAVARRYGAPVADDLHEGWQLFDEHASRGARMLVRGLFDDPGPLVRALEAEPAGLLHGDLKLDNIGLDAAGRMWLIDWAMTLVAAPAVELGWFLAINSRRMPASLDDVLDGYAKAARIPADRRARHDGLAVICGLLLRGWRKALDAQAGEPSELRWWCERGEAAERFL